nr:immunoglobulin light chain junction region [Macaca mulatta]
CHHHNTFPWTF